MINKKSELLLAVDQNWKQSYANRPDNSAIFSDFVNIKNNQITKFFTNLDEKSRDLDAVVEFIGMMKLSPKSSDIFLNHDQ